MARRGATKAETPVVDEGGEDVRDHVRRTVAARTGLAEEHARDLEVGIFNWTLEKADERKLAKNWRNSRFRTLYRTKARSVVANMDPTSYVGNGRLLSRLLEGEFKPHDVPFMTCDHVFPERWRRVLDLKLQKDEYLSTAQPAATTDMFKCERCKKRQCQYQTMQIRSSDEPSTIFVQCLVCSNSWRIG